jgi:hypothetical protein
VDYAREENLNTHLKLLDQYSNANQLEDPLANLGRQEDNEYRNTPYGEDSFTSNHNAPIFKPNPKQMPIHGDNYSFHGYMPPQP